ncbi:MAG: LytTR family transcriptional regulator DNA-binding domain-containing protein [Bacteroidota bacterium]
MPVHDNFFLEGMKEYLRTHTSAKAYITKVGITKPEEELGTGFLRVHRSFLVAIGKIHAYDATELEVGRKLIPIGRNYKDSVISSLAGKF